MNAVVYGYGIVGKATAHAFGIKKYFSRSESNISLRDSSRLRYHFICLPTPFEGGRYNIDPIKKLIRQVLDYHGGQNIFIVRSTVLPGTIKQLCKTTGTEAIVHVPEFLSEVTAKKDAETPDLVVVGCDRPNYRRDVAGIFKARYRGVDILETDSITAELIKCSRNAFYSTKVLFASEIYEIAQRVGANYETVKNALYKSSWVGKNHLDVYYKRADWERARRGLHGKCLPKDLRALAEFSQSKLLKTVVKLDDEYKE
jgi:UDPglucose 6-dehydrogenase